MMIWLTQEERERFAAYCTQESESKAKMAEAIEAQEHLGAMREHLTKKERAEAAAFRIVARYLSSIEEG